MPGESRHHASSRADGRVWFLTLFFLYHNLASSELVSLSFPLLFTRTFLAFISSSVLTPSSSILHCFPFRFCFHFFSTFPLLVVPTMTGAHLGLQFEADSVPPVHPVLTITFIPVSSTQHRNLGDPGPCPRTQAPTPSTEPRTSHVHPPLPAPPPQLTPQPPELPFPPPRAPAPIRLFADQGPAPPPMAEVKGNKKPVLPPRVPSFKASALDSGELPLPHRRLSEE